MSMAGQRVRDLLAHLQQRGVFIMPPRIQIMAHILQFLLHNILRLINEGGGRRNIKRMGVVLHIMVLTVQRIQQGHLMAWASVVAVSVRLDRVLHLMTNSLDLTFFRSLIMVVLLLAHIQRANSLGVISLALAKAMTHISNLTSLQWDPDPHYPHHI